MPNYPVTRLTTVADCDAVLSIALTEQKNLLWKKSSVERQKEQYDKSAVNIAADLTAKRIEKTALDTVIESLPDSTVKTDNLIRRAKLVHAIFLLESRKTNYGDVALLEIEFDLQRLNQELEETGIFIAEVEARKAAI